MYAGYYGRPRPVAETLDLVGLADQRATRCGQMSGGQRRRLDVALALIGDPELIFLDEPTTGFDPAARQSAWAVIAGLRDLGKTIFLTTHYMEEAEELADRIAVLAAGRIVAQGSPPPSAAGTRSIGHQLHPPAGRARHRPAARRGRLRYPDGRRSPGSGNRKPGAPARNPGRLG